MGTSQTVIIVTTRMLVVKQRNNATGNDAVIVILEQMNTYCMSHFMYYYNMVLFKPFDWLSGG